MLRTPSRYRPTLGAYHRALHYLARAADLKLAPDVVRDLTATVEAWTGSGDADAARRGVEWLREQFRANGETPPF